MKLYKKIFIATLCLLLSFPAVTASAAEYTITANDTFYSLSKLFNTNLYSLRSSNYLTENNIVPGDVIFVPAHVHNVKRGQTMYTIASKYEIPLADLLRANYKTGTSIEVGEELIIPGVKPYRIADSVIPYTSGEVDLLAKLIEAEAGGESFEAKIAVGAVVVNRVQSGEWASSIRKVIYQKFGEYYQFTPVKIGTINNTPSAESKRAAWFAMFGSDPSNGAIYYFDTSSKNQWLWSKPQTNQIGKLVFAK